MPSETKARLLAVILYAIVAILICAVSTSRAVAADWTGADTAREATWQTLWFLDYRQTQDIVARRDEGYYETNPILGRYPSVGRVNSYFAFGAVTHAGISAMLSPAWRRMFQYITIGAGIETVRFNRSIGLRMNIGLRLDL